MCLSVRLNHRPTLLFFFRHHNFILRLLFYLLLPSLPPNIWNVVVYVHCLLWYLLIIRIRCSRKTMEICFAQCNLCKMFKLNYNNNSNMDAFILFSMHLMEMKIELMIIARVSLLRWNIVSWFRRKPTDFYWNVNRDKAVNVVRCLFSLCDVKSIGSVLLFHMRSFYCIFTAYLLILCHYLDSPPPPLLHGSHAVTRFGIIFCSSSLIIHNLQYFLFIFCMVFVHVTCADSIYLYIVDSYLMKRKASEWKLIRINTKMRIICIYNASNLSSYPFWSASPTKNKPENKTT